MSHASSEKSLTSDLFEIVDFLPHTDRIPPQNPIFSQVTPHSTHCYNRQNDTTPSSVYQPCVQSPWTMGGYELPMPEASTQMHNETVFSWAQDNATPVRPESLVDGLWNGVEVAGLSGLDQSQFPPPMQATPKETVLASGPAEKDRTPCSSRSEQSGK